MINALWILLIVLVYAAFLFTLAWAGDRYAAIRENRTVSRSVYSFSLAVYCTSWTFFGSVGLAATTGYDFIPVYIGPILLLTLGMPLVMRVVRIAKAQNITSVSDFIAARYGRASTVSALVAIIAVVGTLPYLALQLKAVAVTTNFLITGGADALRTDAGEHIALISTVGLIVFSILFGTRHVDTSEHQFGMMFAIAVESFIKLAAFILVGLFVVFTVYGSFDELWTAARQSPEVWQVFDRPFDGMTWLTISLLSFVCMLLLPRQFHALVVENRSNDDLRQAAWLFPVYLIAINAFVLPIAAAGLLLLPADFDPDLYVLGLPVQSGATLVTVIAFIGGLSAATAMVVVESVALSVMISNGLIMPLILKRVSHFMPNSGISNLLLWVRRGTIIAVLTLAYIVFRLLGDVQGLAAIGLISFAAVAQFAPAFFGGLMWRSGTGHGAVAGLLTGFSVWAYTLLLPWVVKAGYASPAILSEGPFGIEMLRPEALFYLDFPPLTHGVLWSLVLNAVVYVAVSLLRPPQPIERLQAGVFVENEAGDAKPRLRSGLKAWHSTISLGDLQKTTARYIGEERAQRAYAGYAESKGLRLTPSTEADLPAIRFTENLLSSSIGAASARLVLALLLRRGSVSGQSALQLLDDASEALQYNRDLLQSAIDQVRHGLSVFDKDMRLICWNRQFRQILDLPSDLGQVGAPLDRILRRLAERGDFGPGGIDDLVSTRLMKMAVTRETFQVHRPSDNRIIEIRTSPMPQGGIVTTYSDITDRVEAAVALARANETLERRVRERTAELLEVNAELALAKTEADTLSMEKTRFLAAASHDILQPLNATRLYVTSLRERNLPDGEGELARNIDASLTAVEEIFSAIIDISRMDAGKLEPQLTVFPVSEILEQLRVEYEPVAAEKGLKLRIVSSSAWLKSDRKMLRRMIQNLLSNGIKYTSTGEVRLGVRNRGGDLVIEVHDTGPGIPDNQRTAIFKEFKRLDDTARDVRGLGLGLSIVDRIGKLLGAEISLTSELGRGSTFAITLPRAVEPAREQTLLQEKPKPAGSLSGVQVLCIDNEPDVLAGMRALLKGWGCKVTTATSPSMAMREVAGLDSAPDIILADYHLDHDELGPDAVEEIRKHYDIDIPAIVITADHTAEVEADIARRELVTLKKPIKAAALRALMNRLTAIRRTASANQGANNPPMGA